jgi:hypothetical protein
MQVGRRVMATREAVEFVLFVGRVPPPDGWRGMSLVTAFNVRPIPRSLGASRSDNLSVSTKVPLESSL